VNTTPRAPRLEYMYLHIHTYIYKHIQIYTYMIQDPIILCTSLCLHARRRAAHSSSSIYVFTYTYICIQTHTNLYKCNTGSDQSVHEPLPVCTPRRALLDSRRERERLAAQLSHRDANQGDTHARSPRQHQSAAASGAAPFALTAALQVCACVSVCVCIFVCVEGGEKMCVCVGVGECGWV